MARLVRTSDGEGRAVEALASLRTCGAIWIRCYETAADEPAAAIVAEVLAELGWAPAEPLERSVAGAEAVAILTDAMASDLAYDTAILPLDEARRVAERWVAWLGGGAAFVTNTSGPWQGQLSGWVAVEGSTFELGVIGVGRGRAAVLWVADED